MGGSKCFCLDQSVRCGGLGVGRAAVCGREFTKKPSATAPLPPVADAAVKPSPPLGLFPRWALQAHCCSPRGPIGAVVSPALVHLWTLLPWARALPKVELHPLFFLSLPIFILPPRGSWPPSEVGPYLFFFTAQTCHLGPPDFCVIRDIIREVGSLSPFIGPNMPSWSPRSWYNTIYILYIDILYIFILLLHIIVMHIYNCLFMLYVHICVSQTLILYY